MATAISYLRLALPSRWRLVLGCRARPSGRAAYICGPASVRPLRKEGTASISAVGAAISRPSLPPSRGKVPPKGADEGDFLARIIYGGSPRDSSPQIKGWSRRTVGEGLKVNRPKAERSHPGCAPPDVPRYGGPVWDRPLQKDRNASTFSVGAGVLTRPLWRGSPFVGCGPASRTRRPYGNPETVQDTPSD